MIPLPYSLRKQVPTSEHAKLVGKALTTNEKPFHGHAPGTVLLVTCIVHPVKHNTKLIEVEYKWMPAVSLGGVPANKLYRRADHNALPGLIESKDKKPVPQA